MAELVYNHRGIQLYRGDALQELYLWTLAPTPLFLLTDPPYGTNTCLKHRKTGNPKFTPIIGDEINPEYAAEAAKLLEEDAKNL